jgi:hypothetical protein
MQKHSYLIIGIILIILLGATIYFYGESPSGQAVNIDTKDSICCTFKLNGTTKTCATTPGQTCDACIQVCASH